MLYVFRLLQRNVDEGIAIKLLYFYTLKIQIRIRNGDVYGYSMCKKKHSKSVKLKFQESFFLIFLTVTIELTNDSSYAYFCYLIFCYSVIPKFI